MSTAGFEVEGEDNTIDVGENIDLRGSIVGEKNQVFIESSDLSSVIRLIVRGDNNNIEIGSNSRCRGLDVRIGNHVPAHRTLVRIGAGFTSEHECKFLLYNSGNKLEIGSDCMFSNSIILRCGESPHLIFSKTTGEYLDISKGVKIGDHVWIGERSYITKRASIAANTIVAACSVVTREFSQEFSVIGGNPAKIIKSDVQWIRNHSRLEKESDEAESYKSWKKKYE